MIWGTQWDAVMDWIDLTASETGKYVDSSNQSTSWGNYNGNVNTGETENTKANNIYDLAGNYMEWTQETYNESIKIVRGNVSSGTDRDYYYAAMREELNRQYFSNDITSRPTLYIKALVDTTAPEITVGGEILENWSTFVDSVTPEIEDVSGLTLTLQRTGEEVKEYIVGTEIAGEGEYELTATDEAENTTSVIFQIIETPTKLTGKNGEKVSTILLENEFSWVNQEEKIGLGENGIYNTTVKYTPLSIEAEEGIVYGDVNGSGEVTAIDYKMLFDYINGNQSEGMLEESADVNLDGKVNKLDKQIIKDSIAELYDLPYTELKYAEVEEIEVGIEVIYSITYDLAGGSVATANPTEYTVNTESFTLVNPTKAGYTFAGWIENNGTTPQTTVTIAKGSTGNKTYVANWTDSTAPVINIENGSTFIDEVTPEVTDDSDVTITVKQDGIEIEYEKEEGKYKTIKEAGEYEITITDEAGNSTGPVEFLIVDKPEGVAAIEGQLLREVDLTKKYPGFNWEYEEGESAETKTVGEVGNNTFTVTYTPENTEKYKTVTGIEVTITVKDKLYVRSDIYTIKEDELTIERVAPETTIEALKANIETNANEIKITKEEVTEGQTTEVEVTEGTIATGMKITFKLIDNDEEPKVETQEKTYIISVKGDVNGDSKADVIDIFGINSHRLEIKELTGVYEKAGDVTGEEGVSDGKADIIDIFRINSFRLGIITAL